MVRPVRTYGEVYGRHGFRPVVLGDASLALLKEIWKAQGRPQAYDETIMVNIYQVPSAKDRRRLGIARRRLMDGGYIDFSGTVPNVDVAVSKRGFDALRDAGINIR
jgi:hypothetical protein